MPATAIKETEESQGQTEKAGEGFSPEGYGSKDEFFSACMSHLKDSMPDSKERRARCNAIWINRSQKPESLGKSEPGRLRINYHPYEFKSGKHAIEKSDETGEKRRYLLAIASGPKWDAHEERMSESCIKSFHEQATTGQVLVYSDVHGIKFSEPIGPIVKSWIDKSDNWMVEVRLWDQIDLQDGIAKNLVEKANMVWMMSKGIKPFKPKQLGFSIEGIIPEDGVLKDETLDRRILNKIDLDGVVLVPRPAYYDSVAHAVSKALGEPTFYQSQKSIRKTLQDAMDEGEKKKSYWDERWALDRAFDDEIDRIMETPNIDKRQQLEILTNEHTTALINILIKHKDVWEEKPQIPQQNGAPLIGIEMMSESPSEGPSVLTSKSKLPTANKELLFKQLALYVYKLTAIRRGINATKN
jgi:hypothetical protein